MDTNQCNNLATPDQSPAQHLGWLIVKKDNFKLLLIIFAFVVLKWATYLIRVYYYYMDQRDGEAS
jgi:hypothetical protein